MRGGQYLPHPLPGRGLNAAPGAFPIKFFTDGKKSRRASPPPPFSVSTCDHILSAHLYPEIPTWPWFMFLH